MKTFLHTHAYTHTQLQITQTQQHIQHNADNKKRKHTKQKLHLYDAVAKAEEKSIFGPEPFFHVDHVVRPIVGGLNI